MRWRRHRWCFAGVFFCALAAPAEGKVSGDPKDPSDEERARAVAKEAGKANREGRKGEAIARYGAAWEIFKYPTWMCERGAIELELDRPADAAEHFSVCLRLMKPEDKRTLGQKVERMLKEARALTAELMVEANVPDAELVVNGKVVGKLPLPDPVFLAPGGYGVEVRAPGYHPDARTAMMYAGRSLLIRMRLHPMRVEVTPPPRESAPLEPKKEEKPPAPAPPPMVPEKTVAPLPALAGVARPAAEPVRAAVILAGLGLSVAGTAAGVGGFMAASAAQGEAKMKYRSLTREGIPCDSTTPDPCAEPDGMMDRAMGFTALGVAGIAVSVIGSGLVVYELVRPSTRGDATNAHIAAVVGPGGGSLRLTGRF